MKQRTWPTGRGSRTGGPGFRMGYRPGLDGVRGVAILAVVASHLPPPQLHGVAGRLFAHTRGGFLGVQLFFVLSGFLITGLLLQEREATGGVSLRSFYLRRALRLLPALAILLVGCAAFGWWRPTSSLTTHLWRDLIATLLYAANWAAVAWPPRVPGLLSHTWSLATEEQFYLVWPLVVVLLLRRRSTATVLGAAVAGFLGSVIVRQVLVDRGTSFQRIYYALDTRADALLIGCALAVLVATGTMAPARWRRAGDLLATTGLATFLFIVMVPTYQPWPLGASLYTLISVAGGALVLGIFLSPDGLVGRLLRRRPLVWVGRVSYGLYLWYFPVFLVLTPERLGLSAGWTVAIRLLVAFSVTALSYYVVELPFLRMKDRLATQRRLPAPFLAGAPEFDGAG